MTSIFDANGHYLLDTNADTDTPKFYKNLNPNQQRRKFYNTPRSTTKNFKRFRQLQPRNRGTNHTIMRKGNAW